MSKDKNKKTLKIKCDVICPICGENHRLYITKKGKIKGINGLLSITTYPFNPFRHSYSYRSYHCLTCGHKWEVRAD